MSASGIPPTAGVPGATDRGESAARLKAESICSKAKARFPTFAVQEFYRSFSTRLISSSVTSNSAILPQFLHLSVLPYG